MNANLIPDQVRYDGKITVRYDGKITVRYDGKITARYEDENHSPV